MGAQGGRCHRKYHGVVDLLNGIDNTISGPAVTFQVDPSVTARTGFTAEEVASMPRHPRRRTCAHTRGGERSRYTLRVRFPAEHRASLEAMRNTLLVSSTGHTATLGALATVVESPGTDRNSPGKFAARRRRHRPAGRAQLGKRYGGCAEGCSWIAPAIDIRVEYGGTYAEQQRSFHDLVIVLILAVLLLFIVLLFEFGSFAAPIAILSSALLSTSGVFIALLITRTTFNISSFMGMIMVIGIVAKNGILLLDADQKMRVLGRSAEEAMLHAARRRLRPIVMTALATVAGMLPLAFALGAGSQMLQPLAIAVIGGVLISMVLSLIITPAVYFYLSGKKEGNELSLPE